MTCEVMELMAGRPYAAAVNNLAHPTPQVGTVLREWRAARRLSQLGLALDAGISTRHLSCIETGKAQPSRDVVTRLADALDMPLRERNALLVAAGYAPRYPETALATPELAQVRRAIEFILAQQEPYPAFVLNRRWDVLMANDAAMRVNGYVMRGRASAHRNMIRQIFDPDDLRAAVANWEEVAGDLIHHLHAEVRPRRRTWQRAHCSMTCWPTPAFRHAGAGATWKPRRRRCSRQYCSATTGNCASFRPSPRSARRVT